MEEPSWIPRIGDMDEWNPRPICGVSGEAILFLSTAVPYDLSGSISFGVVPKYIDVSRISYKNPSPERFNSRPLGIPHESILSPA